VVALAIGVHGRIRLSLTDGANVFNQVSAFHVCNEFGVGALEGRDTSSAAFR
jgi:hypothetical protein